MKNRNKINKKRQNKTSNKNITKQKKTKDFTQMIILKKLLKFAMTYLKKYLENQMKQ